MTSVSCQSEKTVGANPFFEAWDTPFGVPPFDRIRPAHFLPALERGMSLHDAEIDAITSNNDEPTFENVILAYDNSGGMLDQVALIFGMLCEAENTPEMQALQEEVMPLLAAHAPSMTGGRPSSWMPNSCGCSRRPTGRSCAPGHCSTPNRRPA